MDTRQEKSLSAPGMCIIVWRGGRAGAYNFFCELYLVQTLEIKKTQKKRLSASGCYIGCFPQQRCIVGWSGGYLTIYTTSTFVVW